MSQTQIFSNVGDIVEKAFELMKNASLNDKFIELQAIISSMIVISIMYQGYLTLAGRQQDPIRELAWDIGRKMLILCFVLNVNGWLNLSIDTLNGIYEWAGGGSEFYAKLDNLTNAFLASIKNVWDKHNGLDAIIGCFICFFMLISFLAIIFTFAFTVIKTSITNTLLIIVLPLVLLFFMYQATKQIFQQWLQMFFSNIILLILLTNFIDFVCGNIGTLYNQGNKSDNVFIQILFPILISAILITIIGSIQGLSSNLAQVSLDTSADKAMGQLGSNAGLAFKGGKKAGKLGWGGTKLAGKGAWGAGKFLGKGGYGLAKKAWGAIKG